MLYLLALLAAGQAAAPAATGATSLQQRFDAATQAAATPAKCQEAIAGFEAIERSGAAQRNGLVRSASDVRKGRCLVVVGRDAEGEAAIRRGLPQLQARGADFDADVRDAYIMLGQVALRRSDNDAAVAEFQRALEKSQGAARILPQLMMAQALMFDRDGRALRHAEAAQAIVTSTPGLSKRDVARVQTIYARVLLNEGRDKEAYDVLRDSLAKQGGLGMKVSLDDIATRSDLAIAALRNNDVEAARRYLVYTGAGRMKDAPFRTAVEMEPPICNPTAGIKPEDVTIVEFTLHDDGHVSDVAPIYTTGGRASAIAFAEAVRGWSWKAEDAKAIPLFFRASTRIELRCISTSERPSIYAPSREAMAAWFESRGLSRADWADLPEARALPLQRAAANKGGAAGLRGMLAVALSPLVDQKEREAMRDQARARAAELGAPPAAQVLLASIETKSYVGTSYREAKREALAQPDVAADPVAAATLRLAIVAPRYKAKPPADALPLLEAVVTGPLPVSHPLKVAALLQKANVLAEAGDYAGAQAAFRQTGLTAEQCSLLGLTPATTRHGGGSSDYPDAAVRHGFEGWVRAEFDVTADGRTATQRAVAAYPPFIFNDAAIGVVRGARFTSSYRPEGALACSGQQRSIVFKMP
jgi:tetratricopeptide (TPR) repeat protein